MKDLEKFLAFLGAIIFVLWLIAFIEYNCSSSEMTETEFLLLTQ